LIASTDDKGKLSVWKMMGIENEEVTKYYLSKVWEVDVGTPITKL
jgi:hypothetical protein